MAEYQCSSNASSVNQCVIKPVSDVEALDTTPFKNEISVCDRKGKNIIGVSTGDENSVGKSLGANNYNFMSKGQAFFQATRKGEFYNLYNDCFI